MDDPADPALQNPVQQAQALADVGFVVVAWPLHGLADRTLGGHVHDTVGRALELVEESMVATAPGE